MSGCAKCQGRSYVTERAGDRAAAKVCVCSASCAHCGGAGYTYVKREETFSAKVGPRTYEVLAPCSCRILLKRVRLFNEAKIPGVLAQVDFEGYRVSNEAQHRAKEVAFAFTQAYRRKNPAKGFVLGGPVGTGKSHLLAASLTHLTLEAGVPAEYVEISLIYATIRRGFQEGKSGGEIIGPLSEVEVLAIDEIGKGRGSPFEMETLDELISRRYNAGRTTLFATNFSLTPERSSVRTASNAPGGYRSSEDQKAAAKDSELLLRDRVGERIYSRLCEMCDFVELPPGTPDLRRMRQELEPSRRAPTRGK